ncbi:MAG: plastocyanin/azurin family copper-binding protein [Salinigranum sp.]
MQTDRRRFLELLGAGAVATAGLTGVTRARETPVVEIRSDYFDPIGLYVETGTRVRFEVAAGAHSATAYPDRIPSGATAFDSGIVSGGSFDHTFETPGTYDYYCLPHRSIGMVGRIVVGRPGGPAEGSSIPDGSVPDSETIVRRGTVPYGDAGPGVGSTPGDGSGTRDGSGTGDGSASGGTMGPGMSVGSRRGMGPGMGMRTGPGMRSGAAPGTEVGPTPVNGRGGGSRGGGSRGGGSLVDLPLIGGALGVLGVAGGAVYWLVGRADGDSRPEDAALSTLRERYARSEIDEEEFRRRRGRLLNQDGDGARDVR